MLENILYKLFSSTNLKKETVTVLANFVGKAVEFLLYAAASITLGIATGGAFIGSGYFAFIINTLRVVLDAVSNPINRYFELKPSNQLQTLKGILFRLFCLDPEKQ